VALLSGLNHPNIVRYVGTRREQHALLIFLEYVPVSKGVRECSVPSSCFPLCDSLFTSSLSHSGSLARPEACARHAIDICVTAVTHLCQCRVVLLPPCLHALDPFQSQLSGCTHGSCCQGWHTCMRRGPCIEVGAARGWARWHSVLLAGASSG
jgi:hypothetical protein